LCGTTALLLLLTIASCGMDSNLIPLVEELGGKYGQTFTDPANDTFGMQEFQYDILSVDMFVDETESYFIMHITFNNAVQPPDGAFSEESLVGYLEIDADQNPETGTEPSVNMFAPIGETLSTMGVDYSIQFFEYDNAFHTLPVYETEMWILTGYVNIIYGERSCTLQIPLSTLPDSEGYDDDGNIDFGFVLGTFPEPTDVAHEGYSYFSNILN
jgi:hypothetical protein